MRVGRGIGIVVLAVLGAALDGCSAAPSGPSTQDANGKSGSLDAPKGGATPGDVSAAGSAGKGGPAAAGTVPGLTTVFTILLENHDFGEVVGSADAPFLNSLIAQFGLATNYADSGVHPSTPNYLTLISGDPQYPGHIDVNPDWVGFPKNADNLGTQLEAAKLPWRAYNESMPGPCTLDAASPYAPKHDPFLYFADIQKGAGDLCAQRNVSLDAFAGDLDAGTFRYMWITPNLTDDGHDPVDLLGNATTPEASLKASDDWLAAHVPAIMQSATFKSGGVLFITWDEAEGRDGRPADQVPMIVVSPRIKAPGYTSAKAYSHKSYLATVEDILGLPRLPTVKDEPSMLEFFQ
jgi:hypothetical protein